MVTPVPKNKGAHYRAGVPPPAHYWGQVPRISTVTALLACSVGTTQHYSHLVEPSLPICVGDALSTKAENDRVMKESK